MIVRQPWVEHKFNLGIDNGWVPNIMSRIEDCHIRLNHHCLDLSEQQLANKSDKKWSIKEHIGHLIDLEELWINRFLQFEQYVPELIHADMSNQKTEHANHNEIPLQSLLSKFINERTKLISTFNQLSDEVQGHSAFHPRLKVKMKPVDLLFFVAEHDDHHLTSIVILKNNLV